MKIKSPSNTELYDIQVDDRSVRYRSIMNDDSLTLYFSLPGTVSVPLGSYVDFEGQRYTLFYPENFKKHNSRNFEYTLVLHGNRELLKRFKFKDTAAIPYRLKFPLTAKPVDFVTRIVQNMNLHDSGWTVGTCIDATEKLISFNHESCFDVLGRLASEFSTEWEIAGKTIHLRKVEKFKADPLPLSYGKDNGFKSGTGRMNDGDKIPIGRLYVQGGERNIDFSTYGSVSLLLPKSATLEYEGKTYRTDAGGMSITRDGNTNVGEESYDGSDIYPKWVGIVSEVIAVDASKNFYDIKDYTIPYSLNFRDCRIPGEKATIVFQSGILAGREFDIEQTEDELTGYIHAERRFKLVPQEQDGTVMPGGAFIPAVEDKYAVFNIRMPQAYISVDATKKGASWDLFREAVKYFSENETQKFQFTGELDGVWSKSRWLQIGGKIVPGGHVLFSDPQFLPGGEVIRIISVKDYVNNPHKPEITLSNAPISGSFSSGLAKLEAEEVVIEQNRRDMIRFAQRQWRDTKETQAMLEQSLLNFSGSINPVTIKTMQLIAGDESLQFRFVNSKTTPVRVDHNIKFNASTKVLTAAAGIIQHMTLGITEMSTKNRAKTYKFWDVTGYTSQPLTDAQKAFYLYLKCSKTTTSGTFVLSETAVAMEGVSGYYHFLVGILNSVQSGDRSFAPVYGYTEILPGRITTDRIVSQDGNTYFNLQTGEIGGNIKFKSGSQYVDVAQGISDAVNGIEVGGRNLVRGSAFLELSQFTDIGTNVQIDATNKVIGLNSVKSIQSGLSDYAFRGITSKIQAKTGDTFALTIYSFTDNISSFDEFAQCEVMCFDGNGTRVFPNGTTIDIKPTVNNVWQKNTSIFTITATNVVEICVQPYVAKNGRLWFGGFKLERGNKATDWTPAPEDVQAEIQATNNFVNSVTAGLQSQIDGNITSWFYAYIPTLANAPASGWNTDAIRNNHLGDLFYDTTTGKAYRFQLVAGTYSWAMITDTDITKALADAAAAKDTADGKRRVFVAQPTTPYDVGDLWVQGTAGDIMCCSVARATGAYTASDWVKSSKYTDDTAANEAWAFADDAYNYAVQATFAANEANTTLANIASDNMLTPGDKQQAKKEWDIIMSEKSKIDAHADIFGVSKSAYETAYTNLSNYITPLLASLTTTSNIVGTTFRLNFKAYYDARQDLLNAAAEAAKNYSNNLIANLYVGGENMIVGSKRTLTAGENNYKYSVLYGYETGTAAAAMSSIAGDNTLTAQEKTVLKNEWENIQYQKPRIEAIADSRKVSKTTYGAAFANLSGYITPLLADMNSSSSVSASTFNSLFTSYYSARQALLVAAGAYLTNGKTYVLSVGSVVKISGTATKIRALLYDFVNLTGQVVTDDMNISASRQVYTFTVPASGYYSLIIYAGMSGSTSGNIIAFDQLMLQEGNKASAFTPAVRHVSDALHGDTDIIGGLVATNLLMMKDPDSNIRGGMSGLNDNIGFWTGGTYAEALSMLAKIILRKDGSGHLAGGNLAWNVLGRVFTKGTIEAVGGKIGLFDLLNGSIVGRDTDGTERLLMSIDNIPSISEMASNYIIATGEMAASGEFDIISKYDSDIHEWYQELLSGSDNNEISVQITLPYATYINVQAAPVRSYFSDPPNVVSCTVYQTVTVKNSGGTTVATGSVNQNIQVTAAGTYTVILNTSVSTTLVDGTSSTVYFEVENTYVKYVGSVEKTAIGKDGLFSYFSTSEFIHFKRGQGVIIRGKADIPGGLGGGTVTNNGGVSRTWGKVTGCSRSGSTVTIIHNIGDDKYTVQVAMNGSSTWYFQNRTNTSIQVVCAGTFDFTLVRTPY